MAGLVPAIDVFIGTSKLWMAGSSSGHDDSWFRSRDLKIDSAIGEDHAHDVSTRARDPKSKSCVRKNPAAAGHAAFCLALQHNPVAALQYESLQMQHGDSCSI